MRKPRLAIFDFACCEGCQLQIVNMEDEILKLLDIVQPVEWREAISDQSNEYDIALVEGSITRPADEERLKEIRKRARILVALGACATIGGVNKLKNAFSMEDVRKCVYGANAEMPHLNTYPTKALHEVVPVDFAVHGCPMSAAEFAYIVRCLASGAAPVVPNHPVCVECKMRETICRYEYNEVCLGVVTRAGCDAPCPAGGMACFGCRGLVSEPNINGARDIMQKYGRTMADLEGRMQLFNITEARACQKP